MRRACALSSSRWIAVWLSPTVAKMELAATKFTRIPIPTACSAYGSHSERHRPGHALALHPPIDHQSHRHNRSCLPGPGLGRSGFPRQQRQLDRAPRAKIMIVHDFDPAGLRQERSCQSTSKSESAARWMNSGIIPRRRRCINAGIFASPRLTILTGPTTPSRSVFRYATRIGFGAEIEGWGQTVGARLDANTPTCGSQVRFR